MRDPVRERPGSRGAYPGRVQRAEVGYADVSVRRTVTRAVLVAALLLVSSAVRAQNLADPPPNATDATLGLSAAIVLTCLGKRRRTVSVPSVRGRLLQDGRLLRCLAESRRRSTAASAHTEAQPG